MQAVKNGDGVTLPQNYALKLPTSDSAGIDGGHAASKPNKSRNMLWVVVGSFLILLSGLGALLIARAYTSETQILVATRPMKADHQITSGDLEPRTVPTQVGQYGIPAGDLGEFVGLRTTGPVGAESIVHIDQFAETATDGGDEVVIGLALEAGQLPRIGLRRGQTVRLIELQGDSFGSESSSGAASEVGLAEIIRVVELAGQDEFLASILMEASTAAYVANLAAQGRVALVLIDNGDALLLDEESELPEDTDDNESLDEPENVPEDDSSSPTNGENT